jgi:hypothetical protein
LMPKCVACVSFIGMSGGLVMTRVSFGAIQKSSLNAGV